MVGHRTTLLSTQGSLPIGADDKLCVGFGLAKVRTVRCSLVGAVAVTVQEVGRGPCVDRRRLAPWASACSIKHGASRCICFVHQCQARCVGKPKRLRHRPKQARLVRRPTGAR